MEKVFIFVLLVAMVCGTWAKGNRFYSENEEEDRELRQEIFDDYRVSAKKVWDSCAKRYRVTDAERSRVINLDFRNPTHGMVRIIECYLESVEIFKNQKLQFSNIFRLLLFIQEDNLNYLVTSCSNLDAFHPSDKYYAFYSCFETLRDRLPNKGI